MASYQQLCYCKNCKKNVALDDAGKCKTCGSSQIKKSWTVRFRVVDFNGEKQKRLTGFETKKKAESAYLEFMSTYIPCKVKTDNESMKFEHILDKYFLYCTTENAESTVYDKKNVFRLYITPYFKNKNVDKISKSDILDWQTLLWNTTSARTGQPFSWKYLANIRGLLLNFMNYCENIYDIHNPMRTIKLPKRKSAPKQINFWELDDYYTFINTVTDIQWKTMWAVFMFTGARFNEIRALQDSDIKGNTITINKAVASKKNGADIKITPTKNYKVVVKQIPQELATQIDNYKQWKKEKGLSEQFLFGGTKPISENTIRRQLIKDITNANMSYISPHGFRHSYVSMLIHLGISTKVIAELIGDREEQVIKTYGHLYSNAKNDAMELLDAHLSQRTLQKI